MKFVYTTGEPSKILRKQLINRIMNKNVDSPMIKKLERERLEEQEQKILAQLENLRQEKRKIFSLIALNMKKRNEKKRLKLEKQQAQIQQQQQQQPV